MARILISWIGNTDLKAAAGEEGVGAGPIAQAVAVREYDQVVLLADYPNDRTDPFLVWLRGRSTVPITRHNEPLSRPTHFGEIYEAAVRVVAGVVKKHGHETDLTFHLSPGTPAMAAVWIILAKTRFPAELIESSLRQGVQTTAVPFDISADFLPDLLRRPDERLERLSAGLPPEAPEFSDILYRGAAMERIIAKARRVAPRSVPVLIEGDSGTGKELLARAIHKASPRRGKEFIAVNCGALPGDLLESELFGHEKSAFTGADRMRKGHFEVADGGTLFLDEVGELSPPAQVKLLRTLQEGEIVRLGASKPIKVDVRIIAATNRSLLDEVARGAFRSDLFYRLAVAILRLPPLRDRQGDLGLLIDRLLAQVNSESRLEPGYQEKKLSVGARKLLQQHPWPGNVRELLNTLRRAAIWSPDPTIGTEDVREALLPSASPAAEGILNRPLGDGLNLPKLLADVAQHYLARAMDESHGNKSRAAELVGLPSYQTLSNWLKKYEVEG